MRNKRLLVRKCGPVAPLAWKPKRSHPSPRMINQIRRAFIIHVHTRELQTKSCRERKKEERTLDISILTSRRALFIAFFLPLLPSSCPSRTAELIAGELATVGYRINQTRPVPPPVCARGTPGRLSRLEIKAAAGGQAALSAGINAE